MEGHFEYIIRYLSDEFFIEMAQVPYPPYDNFLDRYPETSPLMRNPNDYDLEIPLLASHVGTEVKEHAHKRATVVYEPGEGLWPDSVLVGLTTPATEDTEYNKPTMSLRFGIDTEMFKPYKMKREDNLLHVGIVGSHENPRRSIQEAIRPLYDLEGVRIMFFPSPWVNNGGHEQKIESLGGMEFIKRCVSGNKFWTGLPNVYNQLDVLIRCDAAYGYSFPTLEAAACEVPVIVTDMGIDHHITEAGGGILIKGKPIDWLTKYDELASQVREAVIYMRDHKIKRLQMGKRARAEISQHWGWERHIDPWRKFFRKALELV